MSESSRTTELVPIVDRYLWMLACRALVLTGTSAIVVAGTPRAAGLRWLPVAAAAWLVLTWACLPLVRRSRRTALTCWTASLIGDGLVLGTAWWAMDGPGNSVELFLIAHVLSTTLLASFRTGVKLAMWHSAVGLLLLESAAAGLLGPAVPMPVVPFTTYVGGLWLVALLTAAVAAVNERELRRRRYDSETLRALGLQLTRDQRPVDVLADLARFARDEMLADRVAVVAYPHEADGGGLGEGWGLVLSAAGERLTRLDPARPDEVVRAAALGSRPRLARRLDAADPVLAGLLGADDPDGGGPGGEVRNLLLLPFRLEQASGVVAVTSHRWSAHRTPRVERRLVSTFEQATLHMATALGLSILLGRIRRAAGTDALTGLANRGTFSAALERAVAESRHTGRPFALVMLDLDHFKPLNDTYGHQVGDQVLQSAAGALAAACGDGDLAARYGGEEFAVVLDRATWAEAARAAEELRAAIAAAPTEVPVTASVGVALCPADGADAAAVLGAADAALYAAKRGGRNRVSMAGDLRKDPAAQA
jgi:two-component system cell cycle response regulator